MTKQTGHTPGKWIVLADPVHKGKHPLHDARYVATSADIELGFENGEPHGWRFADHESSIICTMPDSATQKADAALIASAPDLLKQRDALRDALREIEQLLDCGNIERSHQQDCLATARAALALCNEKEA